MAKRVYPLFKIEKNRFTAVFSTHEALQINGGKFNGGFEFNIYKSRPVVKRLEDNIMDYNEVTALQFFNAASEYMGRHLQHVLQATVNANPNALPMNDQKLLK